MGYEIVNGRLVHFGEREVTEKRAAEIKTVGNEVEIEFRVKYDDLPTADSNDSSLVAIPKDSIIRSCTLEVITAFTGGTSYNIGLEQSNGTDIDADGLDAALDLTALGAGDQVACDGALVGASIGGNDGYLLMAESGSHTAGECRIVVRYAPPRRT